MSMIEYAPKTERLHRENRSVNGYWPVGIDYGFSAVKGFSPNKVFCFPNCAIQQKNDESILDPDDTDIIIRDKEGTWIIGQKAMTAIRIVAGVRKIQPAADCLPSRVIFLFCFTWAPPFNKGAG